MSSAPQVQSDWMKQHYEKILLIGVLLILLISAIILVLRIEEGKRLIVESGREIAPTEGQDVKPISLSGLLAVQTQFQTPTPVVPRDSRFLSSELRVWCLSCKKHIFHSDLKCPFCGAEQPDDGMIEQQDSDGDGLPDKWEIEHGLDINNPDDAHYDLDGDGFTNLEEYRWKTNPRDASSHPPLVAKLRFDRVVTEPFRFRFVGVQEVRENVFMFQLNVRTMDQTYFKSIGDVVEGFTITEYRKEQDTLVLTRGERVVPLKRGVDVQDSDITVRFAFLIDRTQPESRVGHTFKLREAEYRLLEATRDGAKIMNLEGNVTHEIGPMSDAERRLMSGPGGMNILLPGALPEPARPGGANTFPVP